MIREESEISEGTFYVIVIGAGINGAGIARDAAMRGLKVLLLDKGEEGGIARGIANTSKGFA
jgi:glycerol-3-phosphate dehydrogenase